MRDVFGEYTAALSSRGPLTPRTAAAGRCRAWWHGRSRLRAVSERGRCRGGLRRAWRFSSREPPPRRPTGRRRPGPRAGQVQQVRLHPPRGDHRGQQSQRRRQGGLEGREELPASIAGQDEHLNAKGDLNVLDDLTVTHKGKKPAEDRRQGADRVFRTEAKTTLEGLVITGGNPDGGGGGCSTSPAS